MIPKIIHYCWFGRSSLPSTVQACIQSWQKYLPDYEIIEWNEDRFDINSVRFVQDAYLSKKYAFVADYIRLYALYHYGGIYFDTDVQVLKPINRFLACDAFVSFELNTNSIATCVIGSKQNGELIRDFLNIYKNKSFFKIDGKPDLTPNVVYLTTLLYAKNNKLDTLKINLIEGYAYVYPSEYFCPELIKKGKYKVTKHTYIIHHFSGSWLPKKIKFKMIVSKLIGRRASLLLKRIIMKL